MTSKTSRLGADLGSTELTGVIEQRLDAIEVQLLKQCHSDVPLIDDMTTHLVKAGGKRFRPLITVLSATLGDVHKPEVVKAAVVVELTHLATLYHDDVMDEATMRRGAVSVNQRFSNSQAILAGDFLFARASELVADLGPEAVRLQAKTFERLVTGQLLETAGPKLDEDPVEFHLKVLAEKTGSLIATSAQFGAEFALATDSDVLAMRKFGELIGVTFQLADDIIDMSSTDVELGKQRGNDLLEGVPTLTTLLVRRNNRPEDQELIKYLMGPVGPEDLIKVLDLISLNPAINQAKEIAQDWANKARTSIQGINNKETLNVLEHLCDAVISRSA
jgi:heptaprenyl diphosphate synthase